MSAVDMPGYIGWRRTSSGIQLETSGMLIEDGVQAVKSVYPQARVYSDGGDAFLDRDDPRNKARQRVQDTPELQQYRDVIFADWPEGDEHLQWIASAPLAEIVSWASEIAEATQNEHDATGVDPSRAV